MLFSPLTSGSAGAPGSGFVLVEWTDAGERATSGRSRLCTSTTRTTSPGTCSTGGSDSGSATRRSRPAPGTRVFVLAGTPHAYWNARPEPTRYRLVMPRRIADLLHALHAEGAADAAAIFRQFDSELL